MAITKEKIEDLTKQFGSESNDSGASGSQIAIMTERIHNITKHLKNNKKDHSGRRGLVLLVSKRRRLLDYLRKTNINSYKNILKQLKIRK